MSGPVSSYWGPKGQSYTALWEMYVGEGDAHSSQQRWQTSEVTSKMQAHRRLLPTGKGQTEWQTVFGFFYFSFCSFSGCFETDSRSTAQEHLSSPSSCLAS